MCHLVLLMPVLAIALFWLTPLSVAAPLYGVILTVSVWVYYLMIRAMRQPVETGTEALIHSFGQVIGRDGDRFRVRAQGATWDAESIDELQVGDGIEIIAVDGLRLKVRRLKETGATPLIQE
jgi:membrane protein implicated in regulation of membrane protease activity